MSAHPATAGVPRSAVLAIAALLGATLIGVSAVRLGGGVEPPPEAAALSVRELRFEDRPDGSIAILDARAQQVVGTVAPGTNGFLRGTMRGLARERKRQGIGPELPFRVIGRADGHLMLEDPGTGRSVDLGAFGPTNAAVFSQLLLAAQTEAPR